jgi:hypothetical protein
MQPPSETAAEALESWIEAQDKLRDKALKTLDDLRMAYLDANSNIEASITARRDKELAGLEELKLTEEEAAEARVLINAKAASEIANHHEQTLQRQADQNEQMTQRTVATFANMAQTIGSSFGQIARDGEITFGRITELLINLATQFALLQASGNGFDLSKLFGGGVSSLSFGGAGAGAGFSGAGSIGGFSTVLHGGGIVGGDASRRRGVPLSAFSGAPRFHSGFMPNEYPAVLERGEGVFTPGQMRALGGSQKIEVVVNNNAGVKVSTNESQEPDRFKLMIELDDATSRLARGEGSSLNRAIRDLTGTRPRGVNR